MPVHAGMTTVVAAATAEVRELRHHAGLQPDRVAVALKFWAGVLQEHAADFLQGDLSILDE